MPDVSVVIPTFNRLEYLKAAVASCFAGNEGLEVEVVIVDDGSTDGTPEWLETLAGPGIVVVAGRHRGAAAARNTGLGRAAP
jgi:glycosyltransferase involved in cell wall biosynthesis